MRLPHIFLAILLTIIWGFNFVTIRLGLNELSPQSLTFARFFLASFPAIFFIKKPAVPFKWIILYGLIFFALQFTCLFTGIQVGMTPGLASLLMQTQVFFTIFLAYSFLNEIPHPWQLLGALLALSGMILVGSHLDNTITLPGFILTIAAAACWGLGNLISKKLGHVNMLSLVTWGSFIAWPPLLLVSLYIDGVNNVLFAFQHLSLSGVLSILYISYPTTLFAFAIWAWLLAKYPASTIVPFTLLVPIFGMFSSTYFLHEELEPWKLIAAILVISGLCVNLFIPKLIARLKHTQTDASLESSL